jgi:uncharacterized damage-inducible protein DinB
MSWGELIKREVEHAYAVTDKLIDLVDDDKLNWKPSSGSNWMTTGQVLMHVTNACGSGFRGLVTGDWGLPEGMDVSKLTPEEMLPPAEKLPSVGSVAEAKRLLAEDRQTALEMLAKCREDELAHKITHAPWSPVTMVLGHYLLEMVDHLKSHKSQLFYYLKLQGKPVNTGNLW